MQCRLRVLLVLVLATVGCTTAMRSAPAPSLAGEWTLVELGGKPAPLGADGRAASLQFDAAASRVSGFAGCNRLSGSYTADGKALRFGPAAMTKMFCAEGMKLESDLATALAETTRFGLSGNDLTLYGAVGPLARFTRSAS